MSGPEWTPEPDDRVEPRPLIPGAAPDAPSSPPRFTITAREPVEPDEAEPEPEPTPPRGRWAIAFSFLKFLKPSRLLGRERHEATPDEPPVAEAPAGPEPREPRSAWRSLLSLKNETRVGLAALVTVVFLVAALVVKKGMAGKAVPLAIHANPGDKADPPGEGGVKPAEDSKPPESPGKAPEPSPPTPNPPPSQDEGPGRPPRSAPVDTKRPPVKLVDNPKPPDPAPPPAGTEAQPTPPPTDPMPALPATSPPADPPGGPRPLEVPGGPADPIPLPGDPTPAPNPTPAPETTPAPAPAPPSAPSTAPTDPVSAPPAGLPEMPSTERPPSGEPSPAPPTGPEPSGAPPTIAPMPGGPAEPPPIATAPEPPKALAPPPPPPAPKPETAAPVKAARAPTLESVPTPGPVVGTVATAAESAASLGAGWVVIPSGGKRGPAAGGPAPAEPAEKAPAFRDGPRPRDDIAAADQFEPVVHTVQTGENFWTIAQTYYHSGRYYKALHAANARRVPKIDELYVGTVLRIPPPEELDRSLILPPARPKVADEPTGSKVTRTSRRDDPAGDIELALPTRPPLARPDPELSDEPRRPSYTVKPHETLRSIARDTLNDPRRDREILALNRDVIDDPTVLAAGTTLILPEDAVVGRKAR